jgi:hypothetical protein
MSIKFVAKIWEFDLCDEIRNWEVMCCVLTTLHFSLVNSAGNNLTPGDISWALHGKRKLHVPSTFTLRSWWMVPWAFLTVVLKLNIRTPLPGNCPLLSLNALPPSSGLLVRDYKALHPHTAIIFSFNLSGWSILPTGSSRFLTAKARIQSPTAVYSELVVYKITTLILPCTSTSVLFCKCSVPITK